MRRYIDVSARDNRMKHSIRQLGRQQQQANLAIPSKMKCLMLMCIKVRKGMVVNVFHEDIYNMIIQLCKRRYS